MIEKDNHHGWFLILREERRTKQIEDGPTIGGVGVLYKRSSIIVQTGASYLLGSVLARRTNIISIRGVLYKPKKQVSHEDTYVSLVSQDKRCETQTQTHKLRRKRIGNVQFRE